MIEVTREDLIRLMELAKATSDEHVIRIPPSVVVQLCDAYLYPVCGQCGVYYCECDEHD